MGLTRGEFFARLGLIREIDPLTDDAYSFAQWLDAKRSNRGAAAEDDWHVSFHGSSFPGDNPYACARKGVYTLMDFPRQPVSRAVLQMGDAGKGIEDALTMKWYQAGMLLSNPPTSPYQTSFEDPQHWLTSTVDAIVVPLWSNRGVVAEIKSKSAAVIEEMKALVRGPDSAHVYQVKAQIGLAHEKGTWLVYRCYNTGRLAIEPEFGTGKRHCPEHMTDRCLHSEVLEPVTHGWIYYVSRDNPSDTFEYYFEYDPAFMEAGRAQLAAWRKAFESNVLPQTHFEEKRFSHPFGWQWSKDQYPCKYCQFGDICRDDHKTAIAKGKAISLDQSSGVERAREKRPEYSVEIVRQKIADRWM